MTRRIEEAVQLVMQAAASDTAHPILPHLERSLRQMRAHIADDRRTRERIASGLGRMVLDDISLCQSDLGRVLLEVADAFAQM